MASVTSLDKDLRKMRLEKYTPAAAKEAQSWVEEILGERLSSPDLLESLKDGVALCKLANLAIHPPGLRFKQSAMPFVQMENISLFLRACQAPPLNLQQHDTFLTVDLYEQKDPAQVLQCLSAFSRAAHAANPRNFPTVIGPKTRPGTLSPQGTGPKTPTSMLSRDRGGSVTSNTSAAYAAAVPHRTGDSGSGRWSPTKIPRAQTGSPKPVTSWSNKEHESSTAPAWNIAQYGYMGGASQGNLGIAFGGRRQITSAGPRVPTLADKERRRKEQEAEEERIREEEQRQRVAQEERARLEEERRWEEETQRLREKERRDAEEEKRRWEEEERQWKLTEEKRRKEEEEAEARLEEERRRARSRPEGKLRGQYLSQYRAEEAAPQDTAEDEYKNRIEQLEKQLELARQREEEYERERQERSIRPGARNAKSRSRSRPGRGADGKPRLRSRSRLTSPPSRQDSWSRNDREVLSTKSPQQRDAEQGEAIIVPPRSPRPLPEPTAAPPVKTHTTGGRPLPDPATYVSKSVTPKPVTPKPVTPKPVAPKPAAPTPPPKPSPASRTDRFLAANPAPARSPLHQTYTRELDATAERDAEDQRRAQSQAKTKAAGWASKSLLEREMEMERQRQQEWEEAQKETAAAMRDGDGVDGIGGGIGGRWDVGQWSGFTGGDSQNKGTQGIGAGRRQIVGPRPLPDQPR